jgi:hypothetical protein
LSKLRKLRIDGSRSHQQEGDGFLVVLKFLKLAGRSLAPAVVILGRCYDCVTISALAALPNVAAVVVNRRGRILANACNRGRACRRADTAFDTAADFLTDTRDCRHAIAGTADSSRSRLANAGYRGNARDRAR